MWPTRSVFVDEYCAISSTRLFLYLSRIVQLKIEFQCVRFEPNFRTSSRGAKYAPTPWTHAATGSCSSKEALNSPTASLENARAHWSIQRLRIPINSALFLHEAHIPNTAIRHLLPVPLHFLDSISSIRRPELKHSVHAGCFQHHTTE